MNAQMGYYDMDFIILDFGSDVNILTNQTWESMAKPKLVWSSIQLILDNQLRVMAIVRLPQVPIEVDGLQTCRL